MHIAAIAALFLCVLSVSWANLLVVLNLQDEHKAVYEALGRPSPFYFVGVQWMTNERYFEWLWSSEPSRLGDPKLIRWVKIVKFSLIAFLAAFVGVIVAVSLS